MESDKFIDLLKGSTAVIAVIVSVVSLFLALRSGVLRRIKLGAFEIEATPKEKEQAKALIEMVASPTREQIPFETEQLAQYYAQVLAQSKTSFWFSLIFASMGFLVIIIAVFLYSSNNTGATVAQLIAGVIMDAVASLFFVQSKNAQKSMGEFFDKLRRDRMQVESRTLCESLQNPNAKDALRIQLSLYYAGIEKSDQIAQNIILGTLDHNNPVSPIERSTSKMDSNSRPEAV